MTVTVIRIDGHYRLSNWECGRYAIAYEIKVDNGISKVRLKLKCTLKIWCYDQWHSFDEVKSA